MFHKHRNSIFKIIKYAIIGGLSTFIHITFAYAYIYFIGDSIFISNIVGFLCAYTFSYLAQSKYVFNHEISYAKATKYFVVQFVSLIISILITDFMPLQNAYLKVLIVIVILPAITFVAHSIWTFSKTTSRLGGNLNE